MSNEENKALNMDGETMRKLMDALSALANGKAVCLTARIERDAEITSISLEIEPEKARPPATDEVALPDKPWFTTSEVAAYFECTPQTVRKWTRQFPWFKPSGRAGKGMAFTRETVEQRRKYKEPAHLF